MDYSFKNPATGLMEDVTDPKVIPIARQYFIVSTLLSVAVWAFVLSAILLMLKRVNWAVFVLVVFLLFFWVIKWYRGTTENGTNINLSLIDEYYLNKIQKASDNE